MPQRKRSVLTVLYRTGSRFESPSDNGLSHFLEHMIFRGTRTYPSAHLLATAFEELGGTLDASTAADHGMLSIDVPAENLLAVIPLVVEVFRAPLLSDIEIERGVIREEVLEELGEEGQFVDPATVTRMLAFGDHGLGQPITGPLKNVESFSSQALVAHRERTHVGQDLVVSAAGPLAPERVLRALEDGFGDVVRGQAQECAPPPEQLAPRFRFVRHQGSSQTSTALSFRCPSQTDPLAPSLDLLLRVIDDGMATRLYHELCDKRGLCYSASGTYETYSDSGLVEFGADAADKNAPEVLRQMLNVALSLSSDLITGAEYDRLMRRVRWQQEAFVDNVGASADFMAEAELSRTDRTPEQRLQRLLCVSREDIRSAAQAVFREEGRNVVCVGGADKKVRAELEAIALESR